MGTKARIEACDDTRNMFTFAVMSNYAAKTTDNNPSLLCNGDCTIGSTCGL